MSKLYERLSSLTPLLQGKQVNYLPMMLGALKSEGVDESRIKELIESFIKKMPVGDLGEKLYPKTTFDEYYIHKTNFYLGQLKRKSFDELFHELLKQETDLGVTYDFAGILRVMYALKSEEQLPLAEALAFFDLSAMKKTVSVNETKTYDTLEKEAINNYEKEPNRKHLVILMNLFALKNLSKYLYNFQDVVTRYGVLANDLSVEHNETYPSLKDIKEQKIDSFDNIVLMIMHNLLNE